MTTTASKTRTIADRSYGGALALALVSASSFGPLASPAAVDLGWSPTAVVATRVGGAFLILSCQPCCFSDGSDCRPAGSPSGCWRTGWLRSPLAQLCYFSAVQYLSVGVALLLEYLAPVILIAWHWARTQRRPARLCLRAPDCRSLAWPSSSTSDWAHPQSGRCRLGSGCRPVSQRVLPPQRGQRNWCANPPAAVDDSRDWHRCGDLAGCLGCRHSSAGCTDRVTVWRTGPSVGGSQSCC